MKKLIKLIKPVLYIIAVILIALFASMLVGCEDSQFDREVNDGEIYKLTEDEKELISGLLTCYNSEFDEPECYEINDARFYTQDEVDIMNERFGEMLDQLNHKFWDYYTTEELDEGFEDVIIRFEALELEATPEVQEVYITIAMLNVLIFMYDEDVANGAVFPDSDVEYYEMLKVMRDEYRATLTD